MADIIIAQDTQALVDSWLESEKNGERFPVPFDMAWRLAGYATKASAKRKVLKRRKGIDYEVFNKSVENSRGGRPEESILLTCDTFKHFCLLAETEEGESIRDYFIEAEKKWKLVQEHYPKIAEDIETKRLDQMIKLEELRYRNNQLACDMATMHGKDYALAAMGRDDVIVEVEKVVLEVIDKRCGDRRRGMTDTQLNKYLQQKTGNRFKTGKACFEYLQKHAPELVDVIERPVGQGFINEENIPKAISVLRAFSGGRQMLLGEGKQY